MTSLDVPALSGSLVRIEPLSSAHVPDLAEAAEENRASYGFTWVPRAADVAGYVREQQGRVGLTPFAQIRLADGKAVGCTAYWDLRTRPSLTGCGRSRSASPGWARPRRARHQRRGEAAAVHVRVRDASGGPRRPQDRRAQRAVPAGDRGARRAVRGRAAQLVTLVGAGEEGQLRDSAMYSVIADEWPTVKSALAARVATAARLSSA